MPRKTDKRQRLIEAAKVLIHRQGFNLTTLADIAQEADVPLGNVYYYFKTKDSIGVAVIEKLAMEWKDLLAYWSEAGDALVSLSLLLQYSLENLDAKARFGCPVGGLCQELGKEGGPLSDLAANLMQNILSWTQDQFKALGFIERSEGLALNLISGIQGMHLLTNTFKDPKLAERQCSRMQTWLEELVGRKAVMPARPIMNQGMGSQVGTTGATAYSSEEAYV